MKALVGTEALEIDRAAKRVRVRKGPRASPGWTTTRSSWPREATPSPPPLAGADGPNVFRLWTVPDMDRIHGFLETAEARPR